MPKQAIHTLTWSKDQGGYELSTQGDCQQIFLAGDEHRWFAWLATHTSFTFQGRSGALNVCKEARSRGGGYWYAYHYVQKRLLKRYLGKTSALSIERLEEIARALSGEIFEAHKSLTPPDKHPLSEQEAKAEMRGEPLLISKLSPPRLPVLLLERTHLYAQLDTARLYGLVLLQAPAGFGKTTGVHHWITLRRSDPIFPPVGWLSLDTADNDPLRFWRLVITACQTFRPDLGEDAFSQISRALSSPFNQSELITSLTILLNELADLRSGGILVVDDYQTITAESIHETFAFFLDHLPTTLCVILLSQGEPPLPVLRWRTRGYLYELHTPDLRFSREETAMFLHQTLPTPLSQRTLTYIGRVTEGWALGLRLLCLAQFRSRTSADVEQALLALGEPAGTHNHHQSLLDYFTHEVLSVQPEPVLRFLLQTSILSQITVPLCEAVTERHDSAQLLEAVGQAGIFLEEVEDPSSFQSYPGLGEQRKNRGSTSWYRYHGLFAEALRREASQRLGDEALRNLARRASLWYEQHDLPLEATLTALFVQDVERIAELLERPRADWFLPELLAIRGWLLQIPVEVLRPYPLLSLYAALAAVFQGRGSAISAELRQRIELLLQIAGQGWQNQGRPIFSGLIDASRALSGVSLGLSLRQVSRAQQALDEYPAEGLNRHIRLWQSLCLAIGALWDIRDGRFDERRQMIQNEYARSLIVGNSHLGRAMLLLLGLGNFTEGKLHQAHEYYQQVLSGAREEEDHGDTAHALLGLAQISLEWNDLERAEKEAHEALALLHHAEPAQSAPAAMLLARLAHAHGQLASAQQQLAHLIARLEATSPSFVLGLFPQIFSTLWIYQGRLHLAMGNVQAAQGSVEQLPHRVQTLDFIQHIEAQILQDSLLCHKGFGRNFSRGRLQSKTMRMCITPEKAPIS